MIKNVFQQFEKDWNYFKFQIEEMFESGDGSRVTVVGAYLGEHKQTQKVVKAATVHIFEIGHLKVKKVSTIYRHGTG